MAHLSFTWLRYYFSFLAKIDQTISVRGDLQPSASITDVQSPSTGVVSQIFVTDGQSVTKGTELLSVESTGLKSQASSLKDSILLLELESESLQGVIASKGDPANFSDLPLFNTNISSSQTDNMLAARNQIQQVRSQLRQIDVRIKSRSQSFSLQSQIVADTKPLFEDGGISRNNYLRQLNQLQELQAEIASLEGERDKIVGSSIARLAGINRQLLSLNARLDGINQELQYRTIKAPSNGVIFNLSVQPSSVVSTTESLLQIVPSNTLEARVAISNSDIGFVKLGQVASVSVDSFPSGEFGYISGKVTSIGSDSLPPDDFSRQSYFPASISLDQQQVLAGNNQLNLQSGMSISANIKLRSRPVITLLTDIFTRQLDGVKRFR